MMHVFTLRNGFQPDDLREDMSDFATMDDDVLITFSRGVSLLGLRGGGSGAGASGEKGHGHASKAVNDHSEHGMSFTEERGDDDHVGTRRPGGRPPPGAGVLEWLNDSDYEAEEVAELERRRNEDLMQGGTQGDDHAVKSDNRMTPSVMIRPTTRLITGTRGGRVVAVCQSCCVDFPLMDTGNVRACCGRHVCPPCSDAECTYCNAAAPCITNDESLTHGPRPAVEMGIARSDIPTYEEYNEGGDWRETERPHGRHCAACLTNLQAEGSSWHICRCGAVRCLACARWPCPGCAAQSAEHWGIALGGNDQAHRHERYPECALPPPTEEDVQVEQCAPLTSPSDSHLNRLRGAAIKWRTITPRCCALGALSLVSKKSVWLRTDGALRGAVEQAVRSPCAHATRPRRARFRMSLSMGRSSGNLTVS